MKIYEVYFAPEAEADLEHLFNWIADVAGDMTALTYLRGLEEFCLGFAAAAERGAVRSDIRPGLRVIGYRGRISLAFVVEDERITFLRIFYGGMNWQEILADDQSSAD